MDLFFPMLALGLVTSLHCVSMCGPMVVTYALKGTEDGTTWQRFVPNLAYQGAKIVSYMTVGLVLGLVGSAFDLDVIRPYTDNTAAQLDGIIEHVLAAVQAGRLPQERLLDAAARVAALSAGVAALRAQPLAEPVEPAPLSPAGFWLRGPIGPLAAPVFLSLASPDNIAAGDTVWGVGEHVAGELAAWLPGATCTAAADLGAVAAVLAAHPGRPLVVQGRDLARVDFLARAVALIRQSRPDAVLVELGWPQLPGVPPVDIATYGSSRGAAICLIKLLAEGAR